MPAIFADEKEIDAIVGCNRLLYKTRHGLRRVGQPLFVAGSIDYEQPVF